MNETRYYLALSDKVDGPHRLATLREMASVHAFTPDTLITPEGAENWQPVRALPDLCAALFPAPAKFQFKPRAFTPTPDAEAPVSIKQILHDNLAAESRAQPVANALAASLEATPAPTPPPGRARRRDYLFACVACNVLGLAAFFFLPSNPVLSILLLSYFTLVNIGLYWVFFQVMDRY